MATKGVIFTGSALMVALIILIIWELALCVGRAKTWLSSIDVEQIIKALDGE